jgi:hypothetical protein
MRILLTAVLLFPLVALAGEKTFDIRIENRKVVQPATVLRVNENDAVTLRFLSNEAVKLHMHGYDLHLDLAADTSAEMRFDAKVSGRFPVTSHGFGTNQGKAQAHSHGHEALVYIEVYPE